MSVKKESNYSEDEGTQPGSGSGGTAFIKKVGEMWSMIACNVL